MFLGVLQLALVVHVRNTLIDCASEGARYAGLADRVPTDGVARTRQLLTESLGPAYSRDVIARSSIVNGVAVVEVEVRAPLPALGLLGVGNSVTAVGHGLIEGPR